MYVYECEDSYQHTFVFMYSCQACLRVLTQAGVTAALSFCDSFSKNTFCFYFPFFIHVYLKVDISNVYFNHININTYNVKCQFCEFLFFLD